VKRDAAVYSERVERGLYRRVDPFPPILLLCIAVNHANRCGSRIRDDWSSSLVAEDTQKATTKNGVTSTDASKPFFLVDITA
jgi:hypothetical protein